MNLLVKVMCTWSREEIARLRYCMYLTNLKEPLLDNIQVAERCSSCRNTISKYWDSGLENLIFFPPQIRLMMFENRKEYIYLIQSDIVHKLYDYFQTQPNVIYMCYASGKFDLLLQTSAPLDILPDRTLFSGSRSNYLYPETPNCTYEYALNRMEMLVDEQQNKSKIKVDYLKEPPEEGSSHYGWIIYPYVKYNLKIGFTRIVKNLHISFPTFHSGLKYLLNVSTVLLPYYPLGFRLYSQYFIVFWSDYEEFLCKLFGCLPCHTSITKVNDALVMYISVQKGPELSDRLFKLCIKMVDLGIIEKFWSSRPIHHWKPDVP